MYNNVNVEFSARFQQFMDAIGALQIAGNLPSLSAFTDTSNIMGDDYRRIIGKIEIPKEEQSLLLKDPISITLYVIIIMLYWVGKKISFLTGRFKGLTLNLTKLKKLYFNMFFMDIFGNGITEIAFSYEYTTFWYISYFTSVLGISIVFWDLIEDLYNMYYISNKISQIPADIELEKALSE